MPRSSIRSSAVGWSPRPSLPGRRRSDRRPVGGAPRPAYPDRVLTGSGLSKAHGQRVLLSDVTVTLSPGRRVALVGGNGTGKTTLLEILAGEQRPDAGTVTRPSALTTAYLPQDRTQPPDGS